jgi:hypothetical protein
MRKNDMKLQILGAALASTLIGLSTHALAQSNTEQPADASAQRSQPATGDTKPEASSSAGSSSTGASTSSAKSDGSFTHGESKRCESLTGADKDQCDKEEATKTQGAAAEEASKKPEESSK